MNGRIGVRSNTMLRALCRGSAVRVNSCIDIKRGIAVRKTGVRSCTLVKVNTAILSNTIIKRNTVVTTGTLILDGAVIPPGAV